MVSVLNLKLRHSQVLRTSELSGCLRPSVNALRNVQLAECLLCREINGTGEEAFNRAWLYHQLHRSHGVARVYQVNSPQHAVALRVKPPVSIAGVHSRGAVDACTTRISVRTLLMHSVTATEGVAASLPAAASSMTKCQFLAASSVAGDGVAGKRTCAFMGRCECQEDNIHTNSAAVAIAQQMALLDQESGRQANTVQTSTSAWRRASVAHQAAYAPAAMARSRQDTNCTEGRMHMLESAASIWANTTPASQNTAIQARRTGRETQI